MKKKKLEEYSFKNLFYSCTSFFSRRWQLSVIVLLSSGPQCFGEIYHSLDGISKKVLSTNLEGLIRKNIIQKREYMDKKIKKVEYSLTDQGKELTHILETVGAWGEKYYSEEDYKEKNYR